MKKILLSLTVAFTFTLTHAQTYTVDMVGSPGQSFIIATDTTPLISDFNLNMGVVGAGAVWSFQGLDADLLDTINFDLLTIQEITDFSLACDLVIESNLGRIVFDKDVSTGLYLHGTSLSFGGFPLALNYNPPQRTIPEVSNLGTSDATTSFVDEILYVGIDTNVFGCQITIDSIELKRRTDYVINFDATGELRLPLDTFAYTLRAISTQQTIDSIFVYCPNGINPGTCFGMSAPIGWSLAPDMLIQLSGFGSGAVTVDSTFTATWYNPFTISPICIVDFTYDSAYADTNFVKVQFKGTNTPDIGLEEVNQISLSLYPNPASNLLMLQTTADIKDATIYIYNAQGQQVRTTNLNGGNTLDVTELTNGMYFYQLANGAKLLHHGKFIIKK